MLNKSDLITRLSSECENIPEKPLRMPPSKIIDLMVDTFISQMDVLKYCEVLVVLVCIIVSHVWRNPKTGEKVTVKATAIPHFKPGKALREAVNHHR
ncbi:MAG: HU family DNA-binding protein [Moraxella osloensis]